MRPWSRPAQAVQRLVGVLLATTVLSAGVVVVTERPAAADHALCPAEFLAMDVTEQFAPILKSLAGGGLISLGSLTEDLSEMVPTVEAFTDVFNVIQDIQEFMDAVMFWIGGASVLIDGLDQITGIRENLRGFQNSFLEQLTQMPANVASAADLFSVVTDGIATNDLPPMPLGLVLKAILGLAELHVQTIADSVTALVAPVRLSVEAVEAAVGHAKWALETLTALRGACIGAVDITEEDLGLISAIEASLASSGPPVAEYLWPAPDGLLAAPDSPESITVQRVVNDLIRELPAKGYSVPAAAASYLQKAEAELAAGNGRYKAAFRYYRLAYQSATSLS